MVKAYEEELNKIQGLKINYASRASDMFCLGFGKSMVVKRRGKLVRRAEYALHIQCAFRITKDNKILVASGDFYKPSSDWEESGEEFDWDDSGANRFDERIMLFLKNREIIIESVESLLYGDLKIEFSEGYVLEIFPDGSDNSEQWRFFEGKGNKPHLVFCGNDEESERDSRLENTKVMAYFSIGGDHFPVEKITEVLMVEPSKTYRKGDSIKVLASQPEDMPIRIGKRKSTDWTISTGYQDSFDINEQLKPLLNKLEGKQTDLIRLKEEYGLTFLFMIVILVENVEKPAMYLQKDIIDFAGAIGAEIHFDY